MRAPPSAGAPARHEAADARADPPPSAARITLLTTLFTALGPITMSMYAPAMPSLAGSLDTSVAMVQLTLTFYLLAFALAQLAHGPLSDRLGRKPVLLVGFAIYLAGSIAAALATGIWILMLARFVQAVGVCAGAVIARAIVRDLFDAAAGARVMAAIGMAIAVAPAIGPVLGGYLDVWLGWRAIFAFQTLCGLVIGAIAWLALEESNPRLDPAALQLRQMLRNYQHLLAHGGFIGYAGSNACMLGGLFAFAAVGPFVFISIIGLTPEIYGWMTLLTTGAYFLGAWVARREVARLGTAALVLRGCVCSTAGSVLLFAAVAFGLVQVPTLIAPMMLMTLGIGISMPGAMSGALAYFPRIAGTASSLLGFLQMGLAALGTVVASLFGANAAWALATIPVVLTSAGLALFVLLVRPGRVPAQVAGP